MFCIREFELEACGFSDGELVGKVGVGIAGVLLGCAVGFSVGCGVEGTYVVG